MIGSLGFERAVRLPLGSPVRQSAVCSGPQGSPPAESKEGELPKHAGYKIIPTLN